MKKLINSFKYAICGILTAFKEEKQNFYETLPEYKLLHGE